MPNLSVIYRDLFQILKLPSAVLHFQEAIDHKQIVQVYQYYTKPHPRYKIIRNKTVGAALIDLDSMGTREKYDASITERNGALNHAKRARGRGYLFSEIDRNEYVDDIHEINTSCTTRQGRRMENNYLHKTVQFENARHFRYFGIVCQRGKLVAYANVGMFGNFCGFSHLIGLRNNDGIMHLLVTEIVYQLLADGRYRYLMYDTFFGALPGMRQFKTMLGFRPYLAKYLLS